MAVTDNEFPTNAPPGAEPAGGKTAEETDAENTLEHQIALIRADATLPPHVRDAIITKLSTMRGGYVSAADIANAIAEAKATATTASTTTTSEVVQASLYAIEQVQLSTAERQQIHHLSAMTLDVNDERSVDAYARALVGPDVPPEIRGDVLEATKRLLQDPSQAATYATINAAPPAVREAALTRVKQEEHAVQAAIDDPKLKDIRTELEHAREVGVANPQVLAVADAVAHGKMSAATAKQTLTQATEARGPAHADELAVAARTSPQVQKATAGMTPAEIDAKRREAAEYQHNHPNAKPPKENQPWLVLNTLVDIARERTEQALIITQQKAKEAYVATDQSRKVIDAVYSFDVGRLNESHDDRVKHAMEALAHNPKAYNGVPPEMLKGAVEAGLLAAESKRQEIAAKQFAAIKNLVYNQDVNVLFESQGQRREQVMKILKEHPEMYDHVSPDALKSAVTMGLEGAEKHRVQVHTTHMRAIDELTGRMDNARRANDFSPKTVDQRADAIIATYEADKQHYHFNDVKPEELRHAVKKHLVELDKKYEKEVGSNARHNEYWSGVANKGDNLQHEAKDDGKAVAASLANAQLFNHHLVNEKVANVVGTGWQNAVSLAGGMLSNLGVHARQDISMGVVHNDLVNLTNGKSVASVVGTAALDKVIVVDQNGHKHKLSEEMNGNREHDIAVLQTVLKGANVHMLDFDKNGKGTARDGHVQAAELAEALAAVAKHAPVTVQHHDAPAAPTVAAAQHDTKPHGPQKPAAHGRA